MRTDNDTFKLKFTMLMLNFNWLLIIKVKPVGRDGIKVLLISYFTIFVAVHASYRFTTFLVGKYLSIEYILMNRKDTTVRIT